MIVIILVPCGVFETMKIIIFYKYIFLFQEHRFETTKLLLDHGADPHARSRYNDDALQTACLKGALQIFNYLISRVSYPPERLADAHELMGSTFLDEHNDTQVSMIKINFVL